MGGTFGNPCDFDPGPGQHIVPAIDYDNFLLKFDSSGNFKWVQTWNAGTDELVANVATSPSGETWVCGMFDGAGDFNPGPGVDVHASLGSQDAFVSRFDPNGNFEWAKTWGEADNDDEALAVKNDAVGNCYITGFFNETVDFDPAHPGTHQMTSAGDRDAFVLELDTSGNYVWSGIMGGQDDDEGDGIAIDSLGNILIAGQFEDNANLSPTSTQSNRISNGSTDIFLTKISSAHQFLWADTWGGTDTETLTDPNDWEYGSSLYVDLYGKAYVRGPVWRCSQFQPEQRQSSG